MPFSPTDLVASFIFTWVLGLAPAFIARRVHKGPVPRQRATLIALISCLVLAVIGFTLKLAAGEPNPRFSPAWILVFLLARWIMIRGDDQQTKGNAPTARLHDPKSSRSPLSRSEMIRRLREMVVNPSTTDEHRKRAQSRLAELERLATLDPPPKRRSSFGGLLSWSPSSGAASKLLVRLVAAAILAELFLVVSGYRLLIGERIIPAGQSYSGAKWGSFGSYTRPVLVCWYWTGRTRIPEPFWHGTGKSERDECSVLHKHKPGE